MKTLKEMLPILEYLANNEVALIVTEVHTNMGIYHRINNDVLDNFEYYVIKFSNIDAMLGSQMIFEQYYEIDGNRITYQVDCWEIICGLTNKF